MRLFQNITVVDCSLPTAQALSRVHKMSQGEFSRLLSAIELRKSKFADLLQRANTILEHPPQSARVSINTIDPILKQRVPWNNSPRMHMITSGVRDRLEDTCQPGTIDPAMLPLNRSYEDCQVYSDAVPFAEWSWNDPMQTDVRPR